MADSLSLDQIVATLVDQIALRGANGLKFAELPELLQTSFRRNRTAGEQSNVDDAFVAYLWGLVQDHADIAGSLQSTHLDCDYGVALIDSPLLSSDAVVSPPAVRGDWDAGDRKEVVYATEERKWYALAQHAPDTSKIRPMDFALLTLIASYGPKGVLQNELVHSSGQDKRSLPSRTDRLCNDGYIAKIRVTCVTHNAQAQPRKLNTSLCTLARYRDSQEFADELSRMDDEATSLCKEPRKHKAQKLVEAQVEAVKPPISWVAEECLTNQIFKTLDQAPKSGMSLSDLRESIFGEQFKKPIETILNKLVDVWQLSQPLALRHLAVMRDTTMQGKSPIYQHFTYGGFKQLVEQKSKSWTDVRTVQADLTLGQGRLADPSDSPTEPSSTLVHLNRKHMKPWVWPPSDASNQTASQAPAQPSLKRRIVDRQARAPISVKRIKRTGGSAAMLRRDIIMELVKNAGGAAAGHREMLAAFSAQWTKRGQDGTPELKTLNAAINQLCLLGMLNRHCFAYRNSHGEVRTADILSLPELNPEDRKVREMQNSIRMTGNVRGHSLVTIEPDISIPVDQQISPPPNSVAVLDVSNVDAENDSPMLEPTIQVNASAEAEKQIKLDKKTKRNVISKGKKVENSQTRLIKPRNSSMVQPAKPSKVDSQIKSVETSRHAEAKEAVDLGQATGLAQSRVASASVFVAFALLDLFKAQQDAELDLGCIEHLIPASDLAKLATEWTKLLVEEPLMIKEIQPELQSAFLKIYASGTLPNFDYEDPYTYPWTSLLRQMLGRLSLPERVYGFGPAFTSYSRLITLKRSPKTQESADHQQVSSIQFRENANNHEAWSCTLQAEPDSSRAPDAYGTASKSGRLLPTNSADDRRDAVEFLQRFDEAMHIDSSQHVAPTAKDGDMLAILSLLASGDVELVPDNIPTDKFGHTGFDYQTRQMDKTKLFCDVLIVPTNKYANLTNNLTSETL